MLPIKLLSLILLAPLLFADGGTVLFHKSAGPFDITLFSKSEALRAGVNDLSVMVQHPDKTTVMNATVLLHLESTKTTGDILRVTAIATHAKASNKLLYAANINIPATGAWRIEADVSAGGETANASGQINVLPPLPPMENYWPYVAIVPSLAIAFFINRKLRRKFRSRKPM